MKAFHKVGLIIWLALMTSHSIANPSTNNALIATGFYLSKDQTFATSPLVMRSLDNGNTWSSESLEDIFPYRTLFEKVPVFASHCNATSCLIASAYLKGVSYKAFILQSDSKQNNWQTINIDHLWPANTFSAALTGLNCKDNECVLFGTYEEYYTNLERPIILISHNHGKTWANTKIDGELSSNFEPVGLSCTQQYCVTVGNVPPYKSAIPLSIMVSHNKKTSWQTIKEISNLPRDFDSVYALFSVNCYRNICLISGSYTNKKRKIMPLLVQSLDSGKHWEASNTIFSQAREATLTFNSCHGKTCNVIGQSNSSLLIAVTDDGGKTWTEAEAPKLAKHFNIKDFKCIQNTCVIAGSHKVNNIRRPFIITTNDRVNWQRVTDIKNFNNDIIGELNAINIDYKQQFVIVGKIVDTASETKPMIIISSDKGKTFIRINTNIKDNAYLNSISDANLQTQ